MSNTESTPALSFFVEKHFFRPREAAAYLSVSLRTFQKLVDVWRIPHVELLSDARSATKLYRKQDLDSAAEKHLLISDDEIRRQARNLL